MQIDLNRISSQQVLHIHIAEIADAYPLSDYVAESRNRAKLHARTLADFHKALHLLGRSGGDRDQNFVDWIVSNQAGEPIYGTEHRQAFNLEPMFGLIIIDEAGMASTPDLDTLIGHGLALTLTGTAIGLAGSLALTRVMSSLLYRTSATDPFTFTICAFIFMAVALMASYIPARRAMRVDPAMVLH